MCKSIPKKLYTLLLLIPLLLCYIIQAFACSDDACSTSSSVCFKDDIYIDQVYNLDPPDIPLINIDSFFEKSDDVPVCIITCRLFDNNKDFLYSDTCTVLRGGCDEAMLETQRAEDIPEKLNDLFLRMLGVHD